jgi:surface protein
MFYACSTINDANICSWNTSNVTDMRVMFKDAFAFNQNIGSWNISKATNLSSMFSGATAFNNGGSSSINNWTLNTTVGANINLSSMFQNATSFNQPIGNWDTSSVYIYNNILNGATAFNQNIGSWKLGPNVRTSGEATGQVTMPGMLANVGMNTENYSRTLIGWANYQHNLNDDFTGKGPLISASGKQVNSVEYGGVPYSNGVAARAFLISKHATLYQNWYGAAVSNTNSKMFACSASYIFKSDDGGDTWKPRVTDALRTWVGIACSSDGTKVVAAHSGGNIWTSTNSGETWTQQTGSGSRNWARVTISSDGSFMAATVNPGFIYTSTDGGVTWTARMSDTARSWHGIAANSNGTNLVATVYNGQIYTSTDSGVNWTARDSARAWRNCCTSADGTKLAAVVEGGGASSIPNGYIFTSSDSGATWTARVTDQLRAWNGISCSSDGSVLAAIAPVAHPGTGGYIHTSSDSGVTWTQRTPGVPGGTRTWGGAISVSGDGTRMLAGSYSTSGEISLAAARLHRSTNSGVTWSRLAYENSKSGNWYLADSGISDSTALYVDMATGTSYLPSEPSILFNLTTAFGTGTLINSPSYDVSDGVDSLRFNGTNQYVLGNSNLGISGNAAFTIGGWVKMNSLPGDYTSFIGNNSTGTNLGGLAITMFQGRPALDFWNTRWRASSALNTNTWYHIMITKAAGAVSTTTKIYINGVEVAGALEGTDGTPNIANSAWVLGRFDSTRYFDGNISSAVAYTRVLTAAEVLALYDAQKSKITPMLFSLNAANSSSYSGSGTAWNDISGSANNATLFGSTTFNSADPKSISFSGGSGSYGRFNSQVPWGSVTNFTVNVWVRPDSISIGGLVSHLGGLFEFFMFSNSFYFRCSGATVSSGSNSMVSSYPAGMTAGNWMMLTASYDGLALRIYFNGTLHATQSAVRTSHTITQANMIMAGAWEINPGVSVGYPLSGRLSSVRLYNNALSNTQISTLYDNTKTYFGL